jgi:hypothetical protein
MGVYRYMLKCNSGIPRHSVGPGKTLLTAGVNFPGLYSNYGVHLIIDPSILCFVCLFVAKNKLQ